MFDIAVSKLVVLGVVALIVIGPEKLPRVARTAGALLGKAQRYVNDVKAEVNRSMELDELRKVKASVETAAQDLTRSVNAGAQALQKELGQIEKDLNPGNLSASTSEFAQYGSDEITPLSPPPPQYRPIKKNWRLRRTAVPHWYKVRNGLRPRAQSASARVARHRPRHHG